LLLDSNNEVYSWGRGIDGQLGQTNRKEISAPLPLESLSGRNVVAIDAGSDFSLAIDKSGTLLSWGSNAYSQVRIFIEKLNFAKIVSIFK
jgi:alpha-tubulin suppressor-like RCC1 family protein